jgi:hypothetical protein
MTNYLRRRNSGAIGRSSLFCDPGISRFLARSAPNVLAVVVVIELHPLVEEIVLARHIVHVEPGLGHDAIGVVELGRLGEMRDVPGVNHEGGFCRQRFDLRDGAGWYSFDADGVHFIGLVNVVNLKAGGLGNLGEEQLKWLADDLKGKSAEMPIVVFAHIPLWTVYEQWGWGTDDGARAIELLKRFGSVTVLNGHIHQVMQKVEGHVAFHTAMATAFPQPAPGTAPSPGPMKVPDDKLRSLLGITDVNFVRGQQRLAIIDKPLQG